VGIVVTGIGSGNNGNLWLSGDDGQLQVHTRLGVLSILKLCAGNYNKHDGVGPGNEYYALIPAVKGG